MSLVILRPAQRGREHRWAVAKGQGWGERLTTEGEQEESSEVMGQLLGWDCGGAGAHRY